MIEKLPYDLYYITATYLSAYDLKSLTQVSPFLRDVLAPSAWNLIYVLPSAKKRYQNKLIEYLDYRFVDEVRFVNVTKYGWFKRQYVHQIVFSYMCPISCLDITEHIDLDQFPKLQHIRAEAQPALCVNKEKHIVEVGSNEEWGVIYGDVPSSLTRKITSYSFHAKYTIHLTISSMYGWNNICNHTFLKHLNLTFRCILDNMDSLIFGLWRCVNVERLVIKLDERTKVNSGSTFKQKYLDLMSICRSLKKLRYLQTSNIFGINDPMSIFDCIVNDLDESVYYEYQINKCTGIYKHIIDNMETMVFPCVKALEIEWKYSLIYLTRANSQFKAFFPNLQHLSLRFVRLGDYLDSMMGSFAEGLQTLKVTVHGPPDMMWVIRTILRLKRLRVLYLRDWNCGTMNVVSYSPQFYDPTYFSRIYNENGAKYDELLKSLVNGHANASLEEIKTWKRKRVENMVLSAIAKYPNVKDQEIDYMVNLILDPEAIVREFASSDYLGNDETGSPKFDYFMSYYYAVWESIFMKCQQLKQLEKLTIDGAWQPFVSPNFEKLVCKHDTLKRVKIRLLSGIEPVNLRQAKYSRFITRRLTPVIGNTSRITGKRVDDFCHTYWVDAEGFKKQFAREIYKEGDYEDVECTVLATSAHLAIIEKNYFNLGFVNDAERGSHRFGQEANTWDFGL